MQYSQRQQDLNKQYKFGVDMHLPESGIQISHYTFQSTYEYGLDARNSYFNDNITENNQFLYPVFHPSAQTKNKGAIILLHGLNERFWNKYLTWAEYLCTKTGKAVILFPIAYHMNRSPCTWTNPRMINPFYQNRLKEVGDNQSLSLANIAFSERISQNPLRFYNSGKQTLQDLVQLMNEIQLGNHPLLETETKIDFFAYSIGALLAQVAFLANPNGLLTHSKLFLFCGGGIFSSMAGESRLIMDKVTFEKLFDYYQHHFDVSKTNESEKDTSFQGFYSMICLEHNQEKRMEFFEKNSNRISGISMKTDKVIPYSGVETAFGKSNAHNSIELLDPDYNFTHEVPFPANQADQMHEIDNMFLRVFDTAAEFLVAAP